MSDDSTYIMGSIDCGGAGGKTSNIQDEKFSPEHRVPGKQVIQRNTKNVTMTMDDHANIVDFVNRIPVQMTPGIEHALHGTNHALSVPETILEEKIVKHSTSTSVGTQKCSTRDL
jgi:hypothetical protein